jgi:hypothetical protein
MFDGLMKVFYWVGLIGGTLLVLAILGTVNQHAKLTSMAAVGDGFIDVLKWTGELLGEAVKHL